jgi:putative endonuclease
MFAMHEGSYFTYITASRSRTLYIGVTGDLLKRVFQHKWGEHDGFTLKYKCDRLVWFESHRNVSRAIAREAVEGVATREEARSDQENEPCVG